MGVVKVVGIMPAGRRPGSFFRLVNLHDGITAKPISTSTIINMDLYLAEPNPEKSGILIILGYSFSMASRLGTPKQGSPRYCSLASKP